MDKDLELPLELDEIVKFRNIIVDIIFRKLYTYRINKYQILWNDLK